MNNLPRLELLQNNDNKNNEYIIFRNDFKYNKKNITKKNITEKIRKKFMNKKNNTKKIRKKNKKTGIFKIF